MKKVLLIGLALISLAAPNAMAKVATQIVKLTVTDDGFEPSTVDVKPGTFVTLKVTRKTDSTCATQINIPSKKIKKDLPLNKEVTVEVGKLEKGEVRFACGMDMVSGIIHVR